MLANRSGSLVLSGDPYQLPPVVKCPLAAKYCLDVSLLERLMRKQPVYRRDPATGTYNPAVMTKLVKNYRSREALLETPSRLFYDGELQACADKVIYKASRNLLYVVKTLCYLQPAQCTTTYI